MSEGPQRTGWQESLSSRLLVLTIGAILLIELIIFVPSAVTRRDNWIDNRVQATRIAALALEAAPSQRVSEELSADLLRNAEVLTVAEIGADIRQLLLAPDEPVQAPMKTIDRTTETVFDRYGHTIATGFTPDNRILRIVDESNEDGFLIEILVPEMVLKNDLTAFSHRILLLSLLISISAGGLVYLVLLYFVVRPIQGVTAQIIQFRDDPSKMRSDRPQTDRRDEIGQAQNALSEMEEVVSDAFRQRQRLARLGEAVAKINHDLRNSLSAAQLVSDGLSRSEDPRVQRALPRLERALERAINLAQNTLQYGKAETPKPVFQTVDLNTLVDEAAAEAMAGYSDIGFENSVPVGTTSRVDPDHLHRILTNLMRNSAQATHEARGEDSRIWIRPVEDGICVCDNGPGLPEKAQTNLFKSFSGSTSKGGTGLGLTIARDLARVMGGDVSLGQTGPEGTTFIVSLPAVPD